MKNEFLKQINTYLPNVDYCSFRFVNKYTNIISVTRNVLEPIEILEDEGLMVTVIHDGGYGYGANLILQVLRATERQKEWAEYSSGKLVHKFAPPQNRIEDGKYLLTKKTAGRKNRIKIKLIILWRLIDL